MEEYEGHGRPWERRERASARAPLHDGRGVNENCDKPARVYGRTGKPGVPRPVDDLQLRSDS